MKWPPILDKLGTLFLVSLTLQYTFAQTQPNSFITLLYTHATALSPCSSTHTHTHTHTAILAHTHALTCVTIIIAVS